MGAICILNESSGPCFKLKLAFQYDQRNSLHSFSHCEIITDIILPITWDTVLFVLFPYFSVKVAGIEPGLLAPLRIRIEAHSLGFSTSK